MSGSFKYQSITKAYNWKWVVLWIIVFEGLGLFFHIPLCVALGHLGILVLVVVLIQAGWRTRKKEESELKDR